MHGPDSSNDSPGITPETGWQSLAMLAEKHPEASITFVTSDGGVDAPVPPEIGELFAHRTECRPLMERLDTPSQATLMKTWNRARVMGGAQCRAPLEGVEHRVWLIDLAERFDGVAIVFTPMPLGERVEEPPDADDYRGRHMVQYVDETATLCEFDDNTRHYLGWTDEELGTATLPKVHPDDHDRAIESWIDLLSEPGSVRQNRLRYQHRDGSWIWLEVTNHNLLDTEGYVRRELTDISDEIAAIATVRQRELVLTRLAAALPSGIAEYDPKGALVFHNARWTELTGQDDDHPTDFTQLMLEPDADIVKQQIVDSAHAGADFDLEVSLRSPVTEQLHRCRLSARPVEDTDGNVTSILFCLDDITESWKLQQRLTEQASTDPLTGLPNRTSILAHIDEALSRASGGGLTTAVMFFDLNGFKRVNDRYGHTVGDELLRNISQAFIRGLRDGDVVGRQGGDEFIVICKEIEGVTAALQIARRLLDAVTGRWRIEGHLIETQASCGVSIAQGSATSAERLISEADLAMYEQKRRGVPEPGLFRPAMFVDQRLELDRDDALRTATSDGSLRLHYQPFIDLATGKTVGFEALLRWQFEGGLAPPADFVGLAERRGLINQIGGWVIDSVCDEAQRQRLRDDQQFFTLNVSPLQLRDPNLCDRVEAALRRNSLPPQALGLELTEGLMIAETPETTRTIHQLNELGVSLIVDDFGTGFASLDYLRTLPVGGIKIDRGFVAELDRPRTASIVATIIGLAETLDLWLVAEGIETEDQLDHLQRLGADLGQGYHFARPAPMETFADDIEHEPNATPTASSGHLAAQ